MAKQSETVQFLDIEREKSETRDRDGKCYVLTALVNGSTSRYRIVVNQSIGGIRNGRILFDLQFENTGGQFPNIQDITKIGSNATNGEYNHILNEWKRQYYTDPELLEAAREYGDGDLVRIVEENMARYR